MLALVLWSALLVVAPRRLAAELGRPIGAASAMLTTSVIAASSVVTFILADGTDLPTRVALAAASATAVAVAVFDARCLAIPDAYACAMFALGVVGPLARPAPSALAGALVGGGLLWGVRALWRKRTGIEGLGLGDVKLAAALGAVLGPMVVLQAVCLGSLSGIAVGAVRTVRRAPGDRPLIPLGTTLSLAGLGLLLLGHSR